ncbi:MAG: diguanylate cyclase [Mycobacteriales bacterium]
MTLPLGPDAPLQRQLTLRIVTGAERAVAEPVWTDREHSGLLALTEQLLAAGSPADVASVLLEAAVSSFGFARGVVVGGTRPLSLLGGHAALTGTPGVGTSAAVERALRTQSYAEVLDLDPAQEPWLTGLLPARADLVVVPLLRRDRPLGALVLQLPGVRSAGLDPRVLAYLQRAARAAAYALGREQRLVELERLAATDPLTKVANRRTFEACLERELARAVRSGEQVSLVILDLDHFKAVNDTHGHPAGDEALRNVAAALAITCREFDTAARYGGEEFAVVLPSCGPEEGLLIADRLRQAVAAAPAVSAMTASAGVATFPDHAGDAEGLVLAADAALLQSKRSGRDRTVLASEP